MEMIEHYFEKTGKCSECGMQLKTAEKGSKYKKAKNQGANLDDVELSFSNRKKENGNSSENQQSKLFVAKPTVKKAPSPTLSSSISKTDASATIKTEKHVIKMEPKAVRENNETTKKHEEPKIDIEESTKNAMQKQTVYEYDAINQDAEAFDCFAEEVDDTQQEEYVDEMLAIGLGRLNFDDEMCVDESSFKDAQEPLEIIEDAKDVSSVELKNNNATQEIQRDFENKDVPKTEYASQEIKRKTGNKNEASHEDEEEPEAHHEPSLKNVLLSKYRKAVLHEEGDALKCSDWLREKRKQNLEKKQEQKETTYEFNFNHDGFYNDTVSIGEAKPDTIGKQILIKVIGSIVALFLIIAFLIYYA